MSLKQFRQIRSVLHLSTKSSSNNKDALWTVRPLFNCLKSMLDKYIIPGPNLSLDESSYASCSKYGRSLIFYNASKPTGKYHFRLYLVCCSSSSAILRFKFHTKNKSDYVNVSTNINSDESVNNSDSFKKFIQTYQDDHPRNIEDNIDRESQKVTDLVEELIQN